MVPALEWYTRYDFFTTVDIRLRYWVFDIIGIVRLLCYALIVAQNRYPSTGQTRVMMWVRLHLTGCRHPEAGGEHRAAGTWVRAMGGRR